MTFTGGLGKYSCPVGLRLSCSLIIIFEVAGFHFFELKSRLEREKNATSSVYINMYMYIHEGVHGNKKGKM